MFLKQKSTAVTKQNVNLSLITVKKKRRGSRSSFDYFTQQAIKKARLITQASLWVTDATCIIFRICFTYNRNTTVIF